MKFLMTDSTRAWEIAYKSFDYIKDDSQKSSRVSRFFKHWMSLQKRFKQDLNSEEMIEALQDLRLLFRYQARAIHAMRALVLSLDVLQNAVSELQNIYDIVVRYPGETPLVLSCRTMDGRRLEISAGARFNVEAEDALIEALTPWL